MPHSVEYQFNLPSEYLVSQGKKIPGFSPSDLGKILAPRIHPENNHLEETLKKFDHVFSIDKERYLPLKVLGLIAKIKPEYQNAVSYWEYIRWMDEICDSPDIDTDTKISFINRQHLINRGEYPVNPMLNETKIISTHTKEFTRNKNFKNAIDTLLFTFVDDIDHQNLVPRTKAEFRHYNYRTMPVDYRYF